jgi:TorA maturation chaperone TorD
MMNEPASNSALARSTVYSALALALLPPDDEGDARASAKAARALGGLLDGCGAAHLNDHAGTLAGMTPSSERYQGLFGHAATAAVVSYETQYGSDTLFRQPYELADIGAFFAAFGLKLNPAAHERVDHISCELELMAVLAAREARALEQGEAEMAEVAREAESSFLRDHLGRFAPAFGERLRRCDGEGFYGRIGRLLRGFVEWDCGRLGVEAGPASLELRRSAEDDAVPMACGSQGGCGLGRCE